MSIRDWVRYHTEIWNDDHEKLVAEIVMKLLWYRPSIRKRILKKVEDALSHVRDKKENGE